MPKSCRFLMNAWLLVFCAIIVAIFVGQKVQSDQISEVEKYVLRAAPVLDDIKMRQGKFPRELPVDVIGKPPYFIGAGSKPGEGYYSDGDNFEFAYEHPSSDTHIRFNSKERSWIASKASRIFR